MGFYSLKKNNNFVNYRCRFLKAIFFIRQMIILFTLIFYVIRHPIILNFIVILIGFLVSYLIFIMNSSAWFCYLLVIVFLSRIIIIFIYIASLVSNENIKRVKLKFINLLIIFTFIFIFIFLNKNNVAIEKVFIRKYELLKNNNVIEAIYKSYNSLSIEITIFLISYLLLVLIVAVKVASAKKRPLRSK